MTVRPTGLLAALALTVACGSKPRPAGPKPIDPKLLAMQLDIDMKQLGAIARRLRGQCDALVAELTPHIRRMRLHAEAVQIALRDPSMGKQLQVEVGAYDAAHQDLGVKIGDDLAESYQACDRDERILVLVRAIPTF